MQMHAYIVRIVKEMPHEALLFARRLLAVAPHRAQRADSVPEKKLAPPNGTRERTELQRWLNFVSSELHKGFSPLFNPAMPEEAKKIFRDRLGTRFAYVDKHLTSNDYLLGKDYSVADAYLFTISNWAARVDVDLSAHANVLAYRKRVGARPAVQAALKAEGLIK
jgi:glutathione S-transferase